MKGKIKSGEGSPTGLNEEAKEAMRAGFQARLTRIIDSLDSLAAVHARKLARASIATSEAQLLRGEAPPSPRAKEADLSARRAELAEVEGDFDQILVDLKSECVLPSSSGDDEGQVPIVEEGADGVIPNPEGVIGEGEAPCAEDV